MSKRVYLLDTSVILPLVRGNALGKYIDGRFGLRSAAQRPFVSVVSLGEVRVVERFSRLSYEERFYWLVDLLALWHELSTPKVRRRWREHKARG